MIQPATLALRGSRTAPLDYVIEFRGIDLTGATMVGAVKQRPDNPGSPDVALPVAAAGTTGLRLISVTTVDSVPRSRIGVFVSEAAMAAIPAASEVGQELSWYWDMELTPSGRVKARYLEGPFVIGGAAASSGTSSTGSGAGGPDAIVTVTDQSVVVEVAWIDLVAPLAAAAETAAASAAGSASIAVAAGAGILGLATSGAYTDLVPGMPTVTNPGGGATTAAVAHTGTGIQISATAFNQTLFFSTGESVGPKHTRFVQTVTPSSIVGGVTAGLAFTSGSNYACLRWQNNGWIRGSSNYVGGPSGTIITTAPAYSNGDVLTLQWDVTGAGDVYLTVSKNGGQRVCLGVVNVPAGSVSIAQSDDAVTASMIHSIAVQTVNSVADGRAQSAAFGVLSDITRAAKNAANGFLAPYERVKPSGFVSPNLPSWFKAYYRPDGSGFFTTLDLQPILSEDDPTVFVQYVDIATGNDANPGTSASPLKSLNAALTNAQSGCRAIIKAKGGLYDFANCCRYARTGAVVLQLVSSDGNQAVSSMHDTALTWTVNSGTTYQATFTNGISHAFDAAHLTSDGDYSILTLATSLANCQATAGSFYVSGTTIYVHASDGRAPDANIRVYKKASSDTSLDINFFYNVPNGVVYIENFAFEGGVRPWHAEQNDASTSIKAYRKNCTFKYSGPTASATETNYCGLTISQDCVAAWAAVDNFHYNPPIFSGANGCAIEQDCVGRWAGTDNTDPVNNSSSSHGGQTIRIRTKAASGDYHHAQNRGIHDIYERGPALSWHLGITSRDTRNGYANFTMGHPTAPTGTGDIMWLDHCTSSGATYDLEVAVGDTIKTSGFIGAATNTGAGTVTSYTP